MKRWLCLILFTVFGLALPDSPSRAADTKRPNILWLIAEDMSPDLVADSPRWSITPSSKFDPTKHPDTS